MSNINIEIEIDLIIFLDGVNLGNNENTKTVFEQLNLKVKNIYFAFAKRKNFTLQKFYIQIEKIIDFINNLKNKETIKKISVKHLSNKWKYFLEYLNKHKLYLEGLENIEYSEKNMTLYQKFISRYSIYNYINKNIFCKLIVITPDDFNNIKELKEEQKHNLKYKLNSFEHNGHINNTNLKMLVLDFENNSPYQHNFIYFCRNYLAYDDNINTVIINNIGKINSQINCKKNIKDNLMHFEKLDNIVYENNLNNNDINENEIKELISFLFYTENLVYLTTIFSKNNKLQFLLYSNKFYIKNIINKINLNKQDIIIKIYFDNIIYELNFCNKELILAQSNSNSEDTEINVDEIIIMINKIKKKFNLELKGQKDLIKKINKLRFNYDSNILTDESQYNIILKALGASSNLLFNFKVFEGSPYNENFRKELFNESGCKLVIFKTFDSNIFGFFYFLDFGFSLEKNNFIFTNKKEIFEASFDEPNYKKEEHLLIRKNINTNIISKIIKRVTTTDNQTLNLVKDAEIYNISIIS